MNKLVSLSLLLSIFLTPASIFTGNCCDRMPVMPASTSSNDVEHMEHLESRKKEKTFCKLTVRDFLKVCENAAISGNLAVGGSLAVAGNTAINGSLAVAGNETIAGTLTVGGIPFGSALAYAYFSTTTVSAIANSADVPFTSTTPSFNVTSAASTGGGTAAVLPAGTYSFEFQVDGIGTTPANTLLFALWNNTTGAIVPNSLYASEDESATPAAFRVVNGTGILTLTAPSNISLRSFTASTVDLVGATATGTSALNVVASMRFTRIQ